MCVCVCVCCVCYVTHTRGATFEERGDLVHADGSFEFVLQVDGPRTCLCVDECVERLGLRTYRWRSVRAELKGLKFDADGDG